MSKYHEDGFTPKSRPEPRAEHVAAAQASADYQAACKLIMAQRKLTWPEAVKVVEKEKVATILAKHNAPVEVPEPAKKG